MSSVPNGADISAGTHPDLSLGSFVSGPSTPGRPLRVPSISSPAPSNGDGPDTPLPRARRPRQSAPGGKGAALSLRDQEKHIDSLKKENFNIKLRVHFLEERLAQLAPDQIDAALKQNINLKIEVQQRGLEIKKLKKLVLELDVMLERLQRGSTRDHDLESRLHERERDLETQLHERERDLEMQLQEREHEIRELRKTQVIIERSGDDSIDPSYARKVEDLRAENEELRHELEQRDQLLIAREEENEALADHADRLQLEVEDLQRRREAESIERSESRAQIIEEREEREALQQEDELELKNKEIDDLIQEHDRVVDVVEEEEGGSQVEELRDVLAERENEARELRLNITELEANTNDLHAKFEATLAHLEQEAEEKDAELRAANEEIEQLGKQVYALEEDADRMAEDHERQREDDAVERETLEALASALKDVQSLRTEIQLQDLQELYDQSLQDMHAHRARQEELAGHIEDLVTQVKSEQEARESLEREFDDSELRRERRALEDKDSALRNTLDDLSRTQTLLSQRQGDLEAVQNALRDMEQRSKELGETHTTARFSLQLEVDRLKQDELSRTRKDVGDREGTTRDREDLIHKLRLEVQQLTTQLNTQTQARLSLSEKLDSAQSSLKTAEAESFGYRTRVNELETRLSKDQRTLLSAENQYRDQLTERNTLLLTIYQYMDKILGVDKTPKKGNQAETKPFTNFSVFHDNLITRLKALSQIQLDFEKRLAEMRRQLDVRWKQIDKFESSVKAYGEAKSTWRRKFTARKGRLRELTSQLVTSRRPTQGDSQETKTLLSRAVNAEKRLLLLSEEKISNINQKTTTADQKWEARVKEYETRLKAGEEKYKRERQGAKERVLELENQMRSLERQNELAQKRSAQLDNVAEANKGPSRPR
ncbi:uncharacterized protein F5891DRAFT_1128771 [Suillus fuscotomentosus]|uniref:Centrosomin N-terminal motif 1 domain-containing protein n=1 Tax=Suillus fuscotomentosus TaxID=1912939 RepID=A0AAD4E5I5_9AGAM|nr:uncharacterized protein F5891DRAFT_1128771 [Suillus fuscotomentosus]KAG1900115.1 hypothetical protein F5891DRAFT_1128771 [Suillus fuscotomentosus]